jgi:hypothetical protein
VSRPASCPIALWSWLAPPFHVTKAPLAESPTRLVPRSTSESATDAVEVHDGLQLAAAAAAVAPLTVTSLTRTGPPLMPSPTPPVTSTSRLLRPDPTAPTSETVGWVDVPPRRVPRAPCGLASVTPAGTAKAPS